MEIYKGFLEKKYNGDHDRIYKINKRLGFADEFHDYLESKGMSIAGLIRDEMAAFIEIKHAGDPGDKREKHMRNTEMNHADYLAFVTTVFDEKQYLDEYATLEYLIKSKLAGERQENATNLMHWLHENGLNEYKLRFGLVPYNGHNLGWMQFYGNGNWKFEVHNFLKFKGFVDEDEEFNRLMRDHANICIEQCHEGCIGTKDVKIFGKDVKNVCSQHSRAFHNPDVKTVEYIKKLIRYSKQTVPYEWQYWPNNH